jgi:hypothetical protein
MLAMDIRPTEQVYNLGRTKAPGVFSPGQNMVVVYWISLPSLCHCTHIFVEPSNLSSKTYATTR